MNDLHLKWERVKVKTWQFDCLTLLFVKRYITFLMCRIFVTAKSTMLLQCDCCYRGHFDKVDDSQNLYWSVFTVSKQGEISLFCFIGWRKNAAIYYFRSALWLVISIWVTLVTSMGLKGGKGPCWSALGLPGVLRKCQEMPTGHRLCHQVVCRMSSS